MIQSKGYAAQSATSPLTPFSFERRDPGPKDVVVEIAYSGICHSDIHQVRDEWGGSMYPMVPGHEIVGKVIAVGSEVKKFKVGDTVSIQESAPISKLKRWIVVDDPAAQG